MTYNAVLFDLDGTLLDTIEDLTDSMNRALAGLGLPPRTVRECKGFVGDGVRMYALRALGPDHHDEDTVTRCINAMRADYAKRWAERTSPYAGIGELLDALTDRGVKLAVLSNKPHHFTKLMVAELLPHWKFHAVRGACEDVPRKPDPAAATLIAEQLGCPPGEFLYVGDTDTDMRTGVAAGMFTVGVLWGFREADELTENGARALVESPREILSLL